MNRLRRMFHGLKRKIAPPLPATAESKQARASEAQFIKRAVFDVSVYTPLNEAIAEYERRRDNPDLARYVDQKLPHGLPEILRGKPSIVLVRHIATPNYETRRFIAIADALGSRFQAFILEYIADQFHSQNDLKLSLGRLRLHRGKNRNNEDMYEQRTIIDVNGSNAKPLSMIRTHWGELLTDFHHGLLADYAPAWADRVVDISTWFAANGPRAKDYYKAFLTLFLKDAILFENFLVDGKESAFTHTVVLPALSAIRSDTGYKPLIVALEPTYNASDSYWVSHPSELKSFLQQKMGSKKTRRT